MAEEEKAPTAPAAQATTATPPASASVLSEEEMQALSPMLEAAMSAVNSLSKGSLTEIKAFSKPPQTVKLVMDAVCVVLGVAPSWTESKKLLGGAGFLRQLADFDKDSMTAARVRKLRKYVSNPEFDPDRVSKVSRAARGLCLWVTGVAVYASIRTGTAIELAAPLVPVAATAVTAAAAGAAVVEEEKAPKAPAVHQQRQQQQRPTSAPSTLRRIGRPAWDDGRPVRPSARAPEPAAVKTTAPAAAPPQRVAQAWAPPPPPSTSSAQRLSEIFGAVEHVAAQLDVLSRFVADMNLRLRVVEEVI